MCQSVTLLFEEQAGWLPKILSLNFMKLAFRANRLWLCVTLQTLSSYAVTHTPNNRDNFRIVRRETRVTVLTRRLKEKLDYPLEKKGAA